MGFACVSTFLVIGCYVLTNFVSTRKTKIVAFEQKAQAVSIGDSATTVLAKLSPHHATTNNADLSVGSNEAIVFRLQGLSWIYYLGGDGKVLRIERKGT